MSDADRETWELKGNLTGPALVRAAASAIEPYAERIRTEVERLVADAEG